MFLGHLSIEEFDLAACVAGEAWVVCHHADGRAVILNGNS